MKLSERLSISKRSGNRKYWRQSRQKNGQFGKVDERKCNQANRKDLSKAKSKLLKIKSKGRNHFITYQDHFLFTGRCKAKALRCEFKIESNLVNELKKSCIWSTKGFSSESQPTSYFRSIQNVTVPSQAPSQPVRRLPTQSPSASISINDLVVNFPHEESNLNSQNINSDGYAFTRKKIMFKIFFSRFCIYCRKAVSRNNWRILKCNKSKCNNGMVHYTCLGFPGKTSDMICNSVYFVS